MYQSLGGGGEGVMLLSRVGVGGRGTPRGGGGVAIIRGKGREGYARTDLCYRSIIAVSEVGLWDITIILF